MSDESPAPDTLLRKIGQAIDETLTKGQEVPDGQGGTVRVAPSAAYLSVALKFCAMHGKKPGGEEVTDLHAEIKNIRLQHAQSAPTLDSEPTEDDE